MPDGRKIASPQFLRRAERKLRKAQQTLSRRRKGSANREKALVEVCSACGVRDGPKPLSVRTWTCAACGVTHDRDVNAARNILALGRRERLNACGGKVRPGAIPAPAREPATHRGAE